MLLFDLAVDPNAFEARTGWAIKPQGACAGDICVPLPDTIGNSDGTIRIELVAERLGMPIVAEPAHGVWALGPATQPVGRMLTNAECPDLELPDAAGNRFKLSSLRGKKVLLVAWSSW